MGARRERGVGGSAAQARAGAARARALKSVARARRGRRARTRARAARAQRHWGDARAPAPLGRRPSAARAHLGHRLRATLVPLGHRTKARARDDELSRPLCGTIGPARLPLTPRSRRDARPCRVLHNIKGVIAQCKSNKTSQACMYGNGKGILAMTMASWKRVMPLDNSWKARVKIGGAMSNTSRHVASGAPPC